MNSNQGVSKKEVEKFQGIYDEHEEEKEDLNDSPPKLEDMSDSLPLQAEPLKAKPMLSAAQNFIEKQEKPEEPLLKAAQDFI